MTVTYKGITGTLDMEWDGPTRRFLVYIGDKFVFAGTIDQVQAWRIENEV